MRERLKEKGGIVERSWSDIQDEIEAIEITMKILKTKLSDLRLEQIQSNERKERKCQRQY